MIDLKTIVLIIFFSLKTLVAKYGLIQFDFKLIISLLKINYLVKFEKNDTIHIFFLSNNRNNKRMYSYSYALN